MVRDVPFGPGSRATTSRTYDYFPDQLADLSPDLGRLACSWGFGVVFVLVESGLGFVLGH